MNQSPAAETNAQEAPAASTTSLAKGVQQRPRSSNANPDPRLVNPKSHIRMVVAPGSSVSHKAVTDGGVSAQLFLDARDTKAMGEPRLLLIITIPTKWCPPEYDEDSEPCEKIDPYDREFILPHADRYHQHLRMKQRAKAQARTQHLLQDPITGSQARVTDTPASASSPAIASGARSPAPPVEYTALVTSLTPPKVFLLRLFAHGEEKEGKIVMPRNVNAGEHVLFSGMGGKLTSFVRESIVLGAQRGRRLKLKEGVVDERHVEAFKKGMGCPVKLIIEFVKDEPKVSEMET